MSNPDNDVDNIINQLKKQGGILKKVEKNKDKSKLSEEELKGFIIDSAQDVVEGCKDMLCELQDALKCDPSPSMVESYSCLVNAFTGAIDTLSKLKLSDDRIKAQKEIKQMDIDHKNSSAEKNLLENTPSGIFLSREDALKLYTDAIQKSKEEEAKVIDV